jgi:hypothetical protein
MNHVQILHSGEVQFLHSLGGQILHPGRPACKFFRLAWMQNLHAGLQDLFALGPRCKYFILACMQYLHAGAAEDDQRLTGGSALKGGRTQAGFWGIGKRHTSGKKSTGC